MCDGKMMYGLEIKKCQTSAILILLVFTLFGTGFVAYGVMILPRIQYPCMITEILSAACLSNCDDNYDCHYELNMKVNVTVHMNGIYTDDNAIVMCQDRSNCGECIKEYVMRTNTTCHDTRSGLYIGTVKTNSIAYIIMGSIFTSFIFVIPCLLYCRISRSYEPII